MPAALLCPNALERGGLGPAARGRKKPWGGGRRERKPLRKRKTCEAGKLVDKSPTSQGAHGALILCGKEKDGGTFMMLSKIQVPLVVRVVPLLLGPVHPLELSDSHHRDIDIAPPSTALAAAAHRRDPALPQCKEETRGVKKMSCCC